MCSKVAVRRGQSGLAAFGRAFRVFSRPVGWRGLSGSGALWAAVAAVRVAFLWAVAVDDKAVDVDRRLAGADSGVAGRAALVFEVVVLFEGHRVMWRSGVGGFEHAGVACPAPVVSEDADRANCEVAAAHRACQRRFVPHRRSHG